MGASAWGIGKIEKFFNHIVVFECPHHLTLSAPLKLHSFSSKMTIGHLPKLWDKKPKNNQ